jgi:hypothetical protein
MVSSVSERFSEANIWLSVAANDRLFPPIDEPDEWVMDHAVQRPGAKQLMTHPGAGPVTAFATEVFLCDQARLDNGKALVSYLPP